MRPNWEKEYQEHLDSLKEELYDYLDFVKKQVDRGELTDNSLIEWGEVAKEKQNTIELQENLLKKLKSQYEQNK